MSDSKSSKQYKDTKKKKPESGGSNPKKPFNFYWIYAIIGVVLISLNLFNFNGNMTGISLPEFEEMIKDGEVKRVVIYNKQLAEVFLTEEGSQKRRALQKDQATAYLRCRKFGTTLQI